MSTSTWTLAAVNRAGLPALPHDLLLHIYSFLDVLGAVALSETCRSLHNFASSRAAWLTLARTLAASRALALPAEKQLTTVPADLTTNEMRAVVRQTTKLANNLNLPNPALSPVSSLALPEAATIVHSTLLPGGRFLLTAQHGGTFACWDLAVMERISSQPPSFPRRRSMRTQTNSVDGVDAEMGSESDDDMQPEYDANNTDELRRPRCVAAWETKAEYVEFAYDLVPGGVLVALMVAVQVGHNPPILKRDMYVVRIDLPTSTAPVPVSPGQYPGPPNPFSSVTPPVFAGRHHGLRFIAHSPLRQPVFISTTFINASGHAGILGDIPDTMVVFVLLFDPNFPLISTPHLPSQPSQAIPIRCASSLVHCGFKVAPGMRYTVLGTPTHVILYAESTLKTISRRIEMRSLRRRWAASTVPITTPIQCIDLGTKVLGTPCSRDFIGSPGTQSAPLFTTVRAMLRKANPKWLLQGLAHASTETDNKVHRHRGRRTGSSRKKVVHETVCALGLSVDVEDRRADIFHGLVLGAHDVPPDSEEEPDDSEDDEDMGTSAGSRARSRLAPGNILSTLADSYSLPTPSQSSLLEPTQTEMSSSSSPSTPILPLRRPFRRTCRVRYKRTIFPTHVNYAHELAGMGSFGRYAAWIEGDGVPEEQDWQKEPLRVMVAPLTRETGAEEYPELAGEEPDKVETAIRQSAASLARVLSVPNVFQPVLNKVSCLAFEDAAGVLVLSTIEGQVHVFGLAT